MPVTGNPVRESVEQAHTADASRRLYRVPEAMAQLSMSRTVIYEQIRSGRLRSVRQGRSRLIPAQAMADYIALLVEESQADDDGAA
ncbi:helix-turn-helix domain-containing protein [Pseudonocardia abyssalis]|uniref:Helix-turn-helix domain-containing protein n=1 Tax=Pseudonocardia abyssalis TaxID=2792008 RepID=A0ABS6URV4_9PSEU|nr:helix-turn-helix domain-containing protein [Pseudonocardia abyssalis]MBW0117234.1 helix-turn-helix domain-containing protein [Pseudonocardia abyssalis]MBW0134979.1 helix-turn-helix domain-containing protein [Pseudonocardia abyssalis]